MLLLITFLWYQLRTRRQIGKARTRPLKLSILGTDPGIHGVQWLSYRFHFTAKSVG